MLPANLLATTLNKLALSERPLITATTDKDQKNSSSLKLEVGQQVQGKVQAQVSPNIFQVRIADQLVQMQLPSFVRSGSIVSLQVVSLQPKLTFSLSASTNPVSTSEQLSSASRLFSSMSQQPIENRYVKSIQQSPLWVNSQSTSPDTVVLADKLHTALSHSGLFYESHQAQWVAGMRTTPQLMQEPQNLLKPQAAPAQNIALSKTDTTGKSSALANAQTHTSVAMDSAFRLNSSGLAPSIPDHLQNLVQQQLHALETRQVLWQGHAWQDQEMRWEVRDESPRQQTNAPHEGQWATELQLNLPHLGNVSARLNFVGGAVSLALNVVEENTRATLNGASSELIEALNQHGIPVTQTSIKRAEDRPA